MKKLNWKEVFVPAATLTVICLVITAALALTNEATKEPIALLAEQKEIAARQEVLPEAADFEEIAGTSYKNAPYLGKTEAGETAGYVIVTESKGYGGTIEVMTGITASGEVSGVTILSQEETVGLGANCEREEFRSQFEGALPAEGFTVYKPGAQAGEGGIEALTSATITSNAVVDAVNGALDIYDELMKGGD